MKITKLILRPTTLILSCLAAFALASLVGCADDNKQSTTTSESSSATMSTDSKDMTHRSTQNSH